MIRHRVVGIPVQNRGFRMDQAKPQKQQLVLGHGILDPFQR